MQKTPTSQRLLGKIAQARREVTPRRAFRGRRPDIDFTGKRVHMIGIGGCGMRGAADLLLRCGAVITGSDRQPCRELDNLIRAGANVFSGHSADNLPDKVDLVVRSAAVPDSNEEVAAARRLGIPVLKYAELLGALMALRDGIAIAGTHGKSTTTALCTHLFRVAGLDPSYVVGATAPQLNGGSAVGVGEHFIVEACEYDRSFLHLRPNHAAILNIEEDHLDCYRDLAEIEAAFHTFAASVPDHGLIVANHDDDGVARAIAGVAAPIETFGFKPGATWRATNQMVDLGRNTFDVAYEDAHLFRASLAIPGRHNVANALAATALAWNAGATRDAVAEGLRSFEGVVRRMSHRGRWRGVTVIDDYAHHPTEIHVTLAALRTRYRPRRLWVVFQPHQHSRTRILMDEFARSFELADEIIVPNIYGSRDSESEIKRTGAHQLVTRIAANGGHVTHVPELSDVVTMLEEQTANGDMVVTMGAGDVWKAADELVERFQRTG
jgi:UDP-N-acetylmuramate--alanine ligase